MFLDEQWIRVLFILGFKTRRTIGAGVGAGVGAFLYGLNFGDCLKKFKMTCGDSGRRKIMLILESLITS